MVSRLSFLFLFIVVTVVGAGTADAQLRAPVIDVNNEFGIAALGFSQSYGETVGGRTVDSEHGVIPGVEVKLSAMQNGFGIDNLYAGIRFQHEQGDVDYQGETLFTHIPITSRSHYTLNDAAIELGKGFLLADNILVTPFVQGGWRGWQRELSSIQNENYTDYYLGAGVMGDLGITDRLVLTGRLGIAETVGPKMLATTAGLPEMSFTLGSAPLYQASIGADYRFYAQMHVYGGVDYTHFSYGASAVNSFGFEEPTSATNEVTFRLGIAADFY